MGRSIRSRPRETRAPPIAGTPASRPVDPNCANIWGRFPALDRVEEWFSSMTSGAILQGLNLPIMHELRPIRSLLLGAFRFPIQVRNFVWRTKMRRRVTMAIQTEGHAQRLGLGNFVHLVDLPMTFHAANTPVHMDGMVEINVIRKLVNLDPGDGLAG